MDDKGKKQDAEKTGSGGGNPGRPRPGRRSAEDRERAVLDLLSGKASVDQIARR